MMRIYIAGPMRGLPNWNYAAFEEAEKRWRKLGYTVFSPRLLSIALGYEFKLGGTKAELAHTMDIDLSCVSAADAIALLPGWEKSSGAAVELALAQFLGMEVYDATTGDQVFPPKKPWSSVGVA